MGGGITSLHLCPPSRLPLLGWQNRRNQPQRVRKLLPPSPRPSRRLEDADRSLSRLGLKSAAAAELVLATVAREGAGSDAAPVDDDVIIELVEPGRADVVGTPPLLVVTLPTPADELAATTTAAVVVGVLDAAVEGGVELA